MRKTCYLKIKQPVKMLEFTASLISRLIHHSQLYFRLISPKFLRSMEMKKIKLMGLMLSLYMFLHILLMKYWFRSIYLYLVTCTFITLKLFKLEVKLLIYELLWLKV